MSKNRRWVIAAWLVMLYASPTEPGSSAARIAASATTPAYTALSGLSPLPTIETRPQRNSWISRGIVVRSRSPKIQLGRITVSGRPSVSTRPQSSRSQSTLLLV